MSTEEARTSIPIFGGRWQPFHNGHLMILRDLATTHPRTVLAVVNPDPAHPPDGDFDRFHPAANPLTYWERAMMLHAMIQANGWGQKVLIVPTWHPRVSMERESRIFPPARQRVWQVPMIDELEERKVEDLRRLGERVFGIEKLDSAALACRSTVVRSRQASGQDWTEMVPPAIAEGLRQREQGRSTEWPVIVGRWQPLHNGHLWLIKEVIAKHGRACIGILSPEAVGEDPANPQRSLRPIHNPFTYWERQVMLTEALAEAELLSRCVIVPVGAAKLGAAREDEAFIPPQRSWVIAAVSAHELGKIGILSANGEEVEIFKPPPELAGHSGALVRQALAKSKDWESLIPKTVAAEINRLHAVGRILESLEAGHGELDEYIDRGPHRRSAGPGDEESRAPISARMVEQRLARIRGRIEAEIIPRERNVSRLGSGAPAELVETLRAWRDRGEQLNQLERELAELDSSPSDQLLGELMVQIGALGEAVFGALWEQ